MENSYEIARNLIDYFNINRQVGHTSVVLNGARHVDCTMVVHDESMAEYIEKHISYGRPHLTTLQRVYYNMCGSHLPLVIDNYALVILLEGLTREVDLQRSEKEKLKDKLKTINSISS